MCQRDFLVFVLAGRPSHSRISCREHRIAEGTDKPFIFISYSHKDEPEHPCDGEIQWLSFVRTYLQPAIKNGIFELFVDEHLPGGTDLKPEIERKLRACDIFVPLISANSTASITSLTQRSRSLATAKRRDEICFYPLLLTPTPVRSINSRIGGYLAKPLLSSPTRRLL